MSAIWKDANGMLPNLLALGYGLLGYVAGWAMLLSANAWLFLPGVLLLGHSMVISAYLIHECAHNTLLRDNQLNARLGRALSWLVGGCYGSYEGIRHKHFRHHVDAADVVAFDYRGFLKRHPFLLRLIQLGEWCWIPATDLLMHVFVMLAPFRIQAYRPERGRVIRSLLIRGSLMALVAWYHWPALVGYALAYCVMLMFLRTMDMHQHTFDVSFGLTAPAGQERPGRAFEQRNTYSNLISQQHPWLNLLVLNFGYHNAHHHRPNAPWYQLPAIHAQLPEHEQGVIPFRHVMASYHRYRVQRVLHADPTDLDIGAGEQRGRDFVGVYGVSFLTAL